VSTSPYARVSYAEQGEDLVMQNLLAMAGIAKPSYLDIGAYHPVFKNNTFLFYLAGGRGVLVEPNPRYATFSTSARPGDTVLEVGIGVTSQAEADYYVMDGDGQLNTFSKKEADDLVAIDRRRIEKVIKRRLMKIGDVIDAHFKGGAPDIVSIDVEGMDLAILGTLDFDRHRPKVLCVETAELTTGLVSREIVELMRSKGYTARGGSFPNTVFLDDRMLSVYAERRK